MINVNNKEHYPCEEIKIKEDMKNKITLEIKLEEIKSINNISHIFENCTSFLSLPDISKWNTEKITNMS